MDAVFGKRNFRNEIIWSYRRWPSKSRHFQTMHDVILFYAMGEVNTFNTMYEPASESYLKRFGGRTQILDPERKTRKLPVDKPTKGMPLRAVWDISFIAPASKERTGFPTQKPLALYERIIKASSNKGDIVLDPFAGCATTCVSAERLGRQWVGIDIWDKAHETVVERLKREAAGGRAGLATDSGSMLPFGEVYYSTERPKRTDDGQIAVPFLEVKEKERRPRESPMSREAMFNHLIIQHDPRCQGCDRVFDDPRYLELDHKMPRTDGGSNELSNRVLLCGPCNRLKSNTLTLTGLRRRNKKEGYMENQEGEHPIMRKIREDQKNAPRLFERF